METDHRIASSLAMIASLLRLEAAQAEQTPESARVTLSAIAGRIDAAARLHRVLAGQRASDRGEVGPFLRELCNGTAKALDPACVMQIEFDMPDHCQLPISRMLALGMIVSEAITNAIRHAHPTGITGRIYVSCRREGDEGLILAVADDGVGLPPGFDTKHGGALGFRIMRTMAEHWGMKLTHISTPLGYRLQIVA